MKVNLDKCISTTLTSLNYGDLNVLIKRTNKSAGSFFLSIKVIEHYDINTKKDTVSSLKK